MPALNPRRTRPSSRLAFTLIEVLLAILIAAGLLGISLFFYHQIAHARNQIIQQTEFTSAARLFMDRLTLELRTVHPGPSASQPFIGDAHFIQFFTTSWPHAANPIPAEPSSPSVPPALRQVSYGSLGPSSNLAGPDSLLPASDPFQDPSSEPDPAVETAASGAGQNGPALDAPRFQFLRFRYWDGGDWLDDWNLGLPRAVEISLGQEPLPDGTLPDQYPDEIFRRVVYLPSVQVLHPNGLSAPEQEDSP